MKKILIITALVLSFVSGYIIHKLDTKVVTVTTEPIPLPEFEKRCERFKKEIKLLRAENVSIKEKGAKQNKVPECPRYGQVDLERGERADTIDKAISEIVSAEKELENVSMENGEDFLEKVEIDRFFEILQRLNKIEQVEGSFEQLQGVFEGEVNLFEGDMWQIRVEVSAVDDDSGIVADSKVTLSKNGNNFSTSSSTNSPPDSFKNLVDDSQAIIMKAGDKKYIQLYPVESGRSFLGNLYMERSGRVGDYTRIGTVWLDKLNSDQP